MHKENLKRKLSMILAMTMLIPNITPIMVFAETPLSVTQIADENIESQFKDENLKIAIKDQLKVSEITSTNILKLNTLMARNKDIKDLTGLEKAKNLTMLFLNDNEINNIEPLKDLTKLRQLYLNNNKVKNIESIANLTELTLLYLENNPIESFSSIENLTKLTHINLNNTGISDLEPLRNLVNAEQVYLNNNMIENVEPLRNLVNIQNLQLSENCIYNIEHLNKLNKNTIRVIDQKLKIKATTRVIDLPEITNNPRFSSRNQTKDYEIKDGKIYLGDFYKDKEIKVIFSTDTSNFSGTITVDTTEVPQTEAQKFTPEIEKEIVKRGNTTDLRDNIKNLPQGATVEEVQPVDTTFIGVSSGKVNIIFSDGSKLENVRIPAEVIRLTSETFTPQVTKEIVSWGEENLDLTDNIKNLPEGTRVEDITVPNINTRQSGEYIGKVKLIFEDDSTKVVDIPVTVNKSEAETFIPDIVEEKLIKGEIVNILDNIKNLPNEYTITDISNPTIDNKKLGKQQGKVEIIFSDGSKKEVDIPVKVVIKSEIITPIPEISDEKIKKEIVDWGKDINLLDNIADLPDGATIKDITDPTINTKESGEYIGKVEITFPDNSKRKVNIPVIVNKSLTENFTPEILPEEIIKGSTVDITDNIKNLPKGTQVKDITDPEIDTTKIGNHIGKVKLIFQDGSQKFAEIPVNIVSKAGIITPVPMILSSDIEKEIVTKETPIDLTDNIKNLPEGTKIEDITNPKIDTNKVGTYTGKVKVTFSNGSTRIVEIPVEVKDIQLPIKPIGTDSFRVGEIKIYEKGQATNNDYNKTEAQDYWIFKIGDLKYKYINQIYDLEYHSDVEPFIENNRTYLPLRFVGHALNVDVSYDNTTRIATFRKGNDVLTINIDTKQATKNGQPYQMELEPKLVKDRLVAPVSVIGKAFNKTVSISNENKDTDIIWNQKTQEVIIYNYK